VAHPGDPSELEAKLPAADAAAADVIKQKQATVRACTTNLHTKLKSSVLQLSKLEVSLPELYSAIVELEPVFVICHPDGLWLQPRLYEGLRRGGAHYLNTWINENRDKTAGLSHHGMLILNCLAQHKRFTTYDEIRAYLEERGMATAFFLKADTLDSYPKQSAETEGQRVEEEEEAAKAARKKIAGVLGLESDAGLEPLASKFRCPNCNARNEETAWAHGKDVLAVCRSCGHAIGLGRDDLV
jgi:hypothetical protein